MNIDELPFIHCIQTPLGNYVFDVNTNQFISISDSDFYREIGLYEKGLTNLQERYSNQIAALKNKGFLSSRRPINMYHSLTHTLEYQLNNNIQQIILQLTQSCNFRCSYCTYSQNDFHFQREHSYKRMDWHTAKKAVDFFFEHSNDQMEPIIGFYGGEPLLEFNLLKQIVEYSEEVFDGKDIKFIMTTNGSLLSSEEIITFLNQHQFRIMVSLDGAAETHDRSSKFASS